MKKIASAFLLLAGMLAITGCANYSYRIVEPASLARPIPKEGVVVNYDPLQYRIAAERRRLVVRITNPTDDPIRLLANRSYTVDPRGASHPMRGRLLAPHSFVDTSLPPQPYFYYSYAYPWFGSRWAPTWNPYWDVDFGYSYAPWSYSYEVQTPYDWKWTDGQARVHLGYGRGQTNQTNYFDHDFTFERSKKK